MNDLLALPPRAPDGSYHVVVESPRGSRVKLKWDPSLKAMSISRPLVLGLAYPFDWGFVPGTRGPDGDPVDAAVVWDVACFPGVVVKCRALGVLRVEQNREGTPGRIRNDRVLMLPLLDQRAHELGDVFTLPERVRAELERFFVASTALTAKEISLLGWGGPAEAERFVASAVRAS